MSDHGHTLTVVPDTLITDYEVASLNAARGLLMGLSDRAKRGTFGLESHEAYSLGRLAECADQAADGIFQTLNLMTSHGIRTLTDEQLHNRKEDTPA